MRKFLTACILLVCCAPIVQARVLGKPTLHGMYLQWGYNIDWYSKSDLHFKDGSNYDFTIHKARAIDKPDFQNLVKNPLQPTIPQFSFRVGVYLDSKKRHAIEVNFDHTKYVMVDSQILYLSGTVQGRTLNKDTMVVNNFIHLEHTNGANFYHVNYVGRKELLHSKKKDIERLGVIYKAGAGIVIPKTDVTLLGERLDNRFHVAGYVLGAEAGFRFYPFNKFFLEVTGKGGFANYTNVLTIGTGRANHHFFYGELIGLLGYDINFRKRTNKLQPE